MELNAKSIFASFVIMNDWMEKTGKRLDECVGGGGLTGRLVEENWCDKCLAFIQEHNWSL